MDNIEDSAEDDAPAMPCRSAASELRESTMSKALTLTKVVRTLNNNSPMEVVESVPENLYQHETITGSRYGQDMYTIIVGPGHHKFVAHRSILEKSPVLGCMCSGRFIESERKTIILPEDNADTFGRLLEHLYGCNDAAFDIKLEGEEAGEKLADLYVFGEKYELPDLRSLVVQNLKKQDFLKKDCVAFFRISFRVLQDVRESDEEFKPFFISQTKLHLKQMTGIEMPDVSEILALGGTFATNFFLAMLSFHKEEGQFLRHQISMLQYSVMKAESSREVEEGKHNASLSLIAKAKRMHSSQHPGCYQCHALI